MAVYVTGGYGIPLQAGSRGGWTVSYGFGAFVFTTRVIRRESSKVTPIFATQRRNQAIESFETVMSFISIDDMSPVGSTEGLAPVVSLEPSLDVSSKEAQSQYSSSEGSDTASSQEAATTAESTENVTTAETTDPSELDEE